MPLETLKITRDVQALLAVVGKQLREAREHRGESIDLVAAVLSTTAARIRRAEAGNAGVSLGMYAMLLRRYGLHRQLLSLGAAGTGNVEAPNGRH